MKKSLLVLAAAAAIAAGCQKTEMAGLPEIQGQDAPMSFKAEVGKTTKAIFNGTTYENETFGMFAYALTDNKVWEADKALDNPIMGTDAGIAPVEIAYVVNAWRANNEKSYFWPNATTTSISFFGYSPYFDETVDGFTREAAKENPETFKIKDVKLDLADGITIAGYINDAKRSRVVDLMYTTPQTDKKYTSDDVELGKLPVQFNHALTQVAFTVKRLAPYAGIDINVKEIKLVDIVNKGSFKSILDKANPDDENWSLTTDKLSYTIYGEDAKDRAEGELWPFATTVAKAPIGIPHLMIPQDATNLYFQVTYTIEGEGVATETVTRLLAMGHYWEMNQRVNYNLVIGLNEITFAPSITDWDVIDINEFKIQASGSSEAKINAAFNGLNNYKKDLLEETKDVDGEIVPNPNEDKCVFTVAVPEGATGNIALDILGKDYFAIDDVVVFRFDNLGADVVFSDVYGWELTTVPAALEAGKPAVVVLVKVDQTDYSAAEFATEAGVNDALDALNVARATYTDEEVAYKFVVDVPAGATGEIALAFAETDNFVAGDQIKLRFDVVGIVDADGVYTVDSQPALTTITGWTMVLSPETLVAGEKAVVTLTKN